MVMILGRFGTFWHNDVFLARVVKAVPVRLLDSAAPGGCKFKFIHFGAMRVTTGVLRRKLFSRGGCVHDLEFRSASHAVPEWWSALAKHVGRR